jgi:hypothetical protein
MEQDRILCWCYRSLQMNVSYGVRLMQRDYRSFWSVLDLEQLILPSGSPGHVFFLKGRGVACVCLCVILCVCVFVCLGMLLSLYSMYTLFILMKWCTALLRVREKKMFHWEIIMQWWQCDCRSFKQNLKLRNKSNTKLWNSMQQFLYKTVTGVVRIKYIKHIQHG